MTDTDWPYEVTDPDTDDDGPAADAPPPTVTVYTKPSCVQCVWTTRALDARGIEYATESILDEQNLAAAKALGHMSAPVVIVSRPGADDVSWAGFREDLITHHIKKAG